MRILYVENHEVFAANVIRAFLSQHRVTVVPSLAAAREAWSGNAHDLLIVDYDLDDGKGDAFVREVRAADAQVVIIAASSHDEGNAALSRAGANAVCEKLKFHHIQEVIEKARS